MKGRITLSEACVLNPQLLYNYSKIKINLHQFLIDSTNVKDNYKTNKNLWIFGAPRSGKSSYARFNFQPFFLKNQNKWWDGYQNQPYVIIDDLDNKTSDFGHLLKIWGDNYGFYGEIKYGTIQISFERLIVTSNYSPADLYGYDPILVEAISSRFIFATVSGIYPNFNLNIK